MKGAGRKPKGRATVHIQLIVPGHPEKVVILRVVRDNTIAIADVDFGKKSPQTFLHDEINSRIEGSHSHQCRH